MLSFKEKEAVKERLIQNAYEFAADYSGPLKIEINVNREMKKIDIKVTESLR
jgi:hypothetical protein